LNDAEIGGKGKYKIILSINAKNKCAMARYGKMLSAPESIPPG